MSAACANAQDSVRYVSQTCNDLVYSGLTGNLYFSCPSTGGQYGNRIGRLDTLSATVTGSMVAGSEPGKLAISDNGIDLYTGFRGASAYRRFNAQTMTSGATYNVVPNGQGNPLVEDIEVMPGSPNTVAISLMNPGLSPRARGVGIYDNGVRRSGLTSENTGTNVIEFGSSSDRIYGYNNETTDFTFSKMKVDADGAHVVKSYSNVFDAPYADFVYGDGMVFSTNGRAVQAETGTLLGSFAASGSVAIDTDLRRVFYLTGSDSSTAIKVFDMDTYVPVGSIAVTGAIGQGQSLVRFGQNGLAFRTDNQIILVQSGVVPEPASILTFALGLMGLARRRAKARTR